MGGSRWAATGSSGSGRSMEGPSERGRRDSLKLARRTPRAARQGSRGPAALRPTCHQANACERLARRSSRPEHFGCRRPGFGRGGWSGWRSAPGAAHGSGTQCSAVREHRRSSPSARANQRAVAYPRRPSASARSLTTGWAAFATTPAQPARSSRRAAAGCSARGMEARQGRDAQRLDAKHDSPVLRSWTRHDCPLHDP